MLLYDAAEFSNRGPGLDNRDGKIQAFSRGFYKPDCICVGESLVSYIIRLVQIGVIATVVQRNVEVDDVSV